MDCDRQEVRDWRDELWIDLIGSSLDPCAGDE